MILSFLYTLFTFPLESVYWVKWTIAYLYIRVYNALHRSRFDLYDINSSDPEKLGYLVPRLEKEVESPFPEQHLQEAADEVFFYGVNSKSEYLVARVARGTEGASEAWLQLKMADGRTFHLAENAGFQQESSALGFSCGRLHMRYLVPMRQWRIHFCGMLRESKPDQKPSEESVFVKFVFMWKASSDVYNLDFHTNPKGIASAMARSAWKTPLLPPIHQFVGALNFYAQSGIISGTVSIEGGDDIEMYFFGEKMRNIGKNSKLAGCKFTQIIGKTPANGFTFHASKASAPNIFNKLSFGFIVKPDTIMENVNDVQIAIRADESDKRVHMEFKTGPESNYELSGGHVGDPVVLYSGQGWNGFLELTYIEFTLNGKKGHGFVMDGECYKEAKMSTVKKIQPVLFPKTVPLTVKFTDEISQFEEISGGKGASLAKLTKLSVMDRSFIVPSGIIVTTEAFKEFLNDEIKSAVKMLEDVTYGNSKGDLQAFCNTVSTLVERSLLPDKVCHSIIQDLKTVFGPELQGYKFAVRSSATGEDTDAMSAAGQMDTFLGVQGIKNVFSAVKKCWASQFGHIAVEYKRRNGQLLNSPMAVVVQEMVACEAAGVLFTCDPVTGNPAHMSLSANYGLGETVVSGAVDPDSITLTRSADDKVEIGSITIGGKQEKIVLKESGGVTTEELDEGAKQESCLSEEMAVKLGKLGIKVEKFYKSPRDIEWGILRDKIYLLQSRPVTSITGETHYEMLHEFDSALRYENEYYSMANVGEVLPGSLTPLALEFIYKNFGNAVRRECQKKGGADNMFQSKYFMTGCIMFYNHLVMTVVETMTRHGLNSMTSKGFMVSIYGRVLDDPDLMAVARDVVPDDPPPRTFFQNIYFFWDMFTHDFGREKVRSRVYAIDPIHKECKTSKEMFYALLKDPIQYNDVFARHMNASEDSSNWNVYMFEILCNANKGVFDTEVYSDFSRLLSTSSEVESADVPQSLQKLSDQIEKDIDCQTFKQMKVEDALRWLKTSNSASSAKYKDFMDRHGHRCLMEFDVRSKTWEMDPLSVVELLQNMCGVAKPKEKTKDDYGKIFSDLNVPLGFVAKALLRFILPNCRRAVRSREYCKSLVIKSVDHFRKSCMRLASMMVAEGRLPDPDLVFFFRLEELQELLETRSPGLISRAIHRRKVFETTMDLKFPEMMKGVPVPINFDDDTDYDAVADLTMKGTPVSHGVTKGYARVALTLKEAALLKPGEILIAYGTDIGWSPYFPIIGGVVTELGGLISHGAVVSREYGLPCVVGLHGATKKFRTGDYVLIDGKKGILQRLPPPTEQ